MGSRSWPCWSMPRVRRSWSRPARTCLEAESTELGRRCRGLHELQIVRDVVVLINVDVVAETNRLLAGIGQFVHAAEPHVGNGAETHLLPVVRALQLRCRRVCRGHL